MPITQTETSTPTDKKGVNAPTQATITWQAPEYPFQEKSADWFWALGIIIVSLAIASILYKNFLFAVLVLLVGILLSLYAIKKPRITTFTINKDGVGIEKTFHHYKTLDSFWIDSLGEEHKILLKSKRGVAPHIVIPINGRDHNKVREFLSYYLPEKEHIEPLSHKIMEYLGF